MTSMEEAARQTIERVAQAIYGDIGTGETAASEWSEVPEDTKAVLRIQARAAIRAIAADGYVIVPREPTEAMLEAGVVGWERNDVDATIVEDVAAILRFAIVAALKEQTQMKITIQTKTGASITLEAPFDVYGSKEDFLIMADWLRVADQRGGLAWARVMPNSPADHHAVPPAAQRAADWKP